MWLTFAILAVAILIANRLGAFAALYSRAGGRARTAIDSPVADAMSPAALRDEVHRALRESGWESLEDGRAVFAAAEQADDAALAARLRALQSALRDRDRAAGRFGEGSESTRFYQSGLLSITEALERRV